MQHVQEEERARLSRGLHDELGGVLLAARMDVTWMQRHATGDDADVRMRLERLKQVFDQGIDLKRRVVEELRPTLLDTMGLLAALRWQSEETCRRADLRCTERFPDEEPPFNRAGAIALFRVVQEALANVAKHARASEVDIALELTDNEVVVTVQDNGVGAAPADLRPAPFARRRRTSSPHPGARRSARHLVRAESWHQGPGAGSIGQRDRDGGRGRQRLGDVRVRSLGQPGQGPRPERQAGGEDAISVRIAGNRS